jgi:hypothetical protein
MSQKAEAHRLLHEKPANQLGRSYHFPAFKLFYDFLDIVMRHQKFATTF